MRPTTSNHRTAVPRLAAWLLAALATACASPDVSIQNAHAGLGCVDDSAHCISQRQTALKSMVGDPSRSWVKQAPTPAAYASGVRLFAFKSKKKELSCDELQVGRREADNAPASLKTATAFLTPGQISRSTMLASEIGRELSKEHGKRCKN